MVKIMYEINSCKECPHFQTGNEWSSDGWDRMEDWQCTKTNRIIQSNVEWFEESKIKIPEWCPFNLETKE